MHDDLPWGGERIGKESSSFTGEKGTWHLAGGSCEMFIVLEYPQGKVKSYWRRAGQEEGLAQEWREEAPWAHERWTAGGCLPLCSAAAVDSERMALPTNTPWRQLKASYTRGTPRTPVNRVRGSPFHRTHSILSGDPNSNLFLLGPRLSHFQIPCHSPILHSPGEGSGDRQLQLAIQAEAP